MWVIECLADGGVWCSLRTFYTDPFAASEVCETLAAENPNQTFRVRVM